MNILIIPTNDWTRAPGAGHINRIAEELALLGHNVYAWNFDFCRGETAKRKTVNVKLIKRNSIFFKDPAIFFAFNAVWQGPMVFKAIRKLDIDVVINENILSGLVSFIAAGNKALKMFDYSDYFPESASVYYKNFFVKKIVEGVTLAITKLNVNLSNVCITVCQSLLVNAKNFDKKKPCYIITNGVCLNQAIKSKPDETALNLVIMGVIDDWLDLDTPINAVKELKNSHANVKLFIIGPWQKQAFRAKIEKDIRELGLQENIEITGYVSSEELHKHLQMATYCIMPYKLDKYYSLIRYPEKFFVYSAYGKPIISTHLPEVRALGVAHIFFYSNVNELVNKITDLSNKLNPQWLNLQDAAIGFAQKHDFKVLAKQLENILTKQNADRRISK